MTFQTRSTCLVGAVVLLAAFAASTARAQTTGAAPVRPPAVQSPPAQPVAATKIPVFVSHTGQDAVGVSLVEGLEDALRRASSTALAASADDADVVLLVSTMNPDAAKPGTVTTAGWTLLLMKEATEAYIGGGLRMCDPGSVPKTAAELITHVEGLLKARSAEIPSTAEFEKAEAAWDEAVGQAAHTLPDETCGVKIKAAFIEQMQTYFKWATAASLVPDVRQAITAGLSYFSVDQGLAKKSQAQAAQLSQCQAEVLALKKSAGAVKK